MEQKNNVQYMLTELGHHLPYSIFSVVLAMMLVGFFSFMATVMGNTGALAEGYQNLFHIFHPAHILFSTVTATAMFWKYEKRVSKALLVGMGGSIVTCTLSDTLIPYWGGMLLGKTMSLHICIIDEPMLIIPFAIVGVLAGFLITESIERSTQYSHSLHIFVSSVASILYLVAFGLTDWVHMAGLVFLVTIIAVMIPCCASDIIFPVLCSRKVACNHRH